MFFCRLRTGPSSLASTLSPSCTSWNSLCLGITRVVHDAITQTLCRWKVVCPCLYLKVCRVWIALLALVFGFTFLRVHQRSSRLGARCSPFGSRIRPLVIRWRSARRTKRPLAAVEPRRDGHVTALVAVGASESLVCTRSFSSFSKHFLLKKMSF